jgi:hypothetical protein
MRHRSAGELCDVRACVSSGRTTSRGSDITSSRRARERRILVFENVVSVQRRVYRVLSTLVFVCTTSIRDNACQSVVVYGARIMRTFNHNCAKEGHFEAASFRSDIRSFGVLSDDLDHGKGTPRIKCCRGRQSKTSLFRGNSGSCLPGAGQESREQVLPCLVASATVPSQDEAKIVHPPTGTSSTVEHVRVTH